MRVAIVTFDGFNELDSFIALGLINRLRTLGVQAEIASPSAQVTSKNGVTITAQQPLEFLMDADAVLFGSGIYTRAIAENAALMDRIVLDPTRPRRRPRRSRWCGCWSPATRPWRAPRASCSRSPTRPATSPPPTC